MDLRCDEAIKCVGIAWHQGLEGQLGSNGGDKALGYQAADDSKWERFQRARDSEIINNIAQELVLCARVVDLHTQELHVIRDDSNIMPSGGIRQWVSDVDGGHGKNIWRMLYVLYEQQGLGPAGNPSVGYLEALAIKAESLKRVLLHCEYSRVIHCFHHGDGDLKTVGWRVRLLRPRRYNVYTHRGGSNFKLRDAVTRVMSTASRGAGGSGSADRPESFRRPPSTRATVAALRLRTTMTLTLQLRLPLVAAVGVLPYYWPPQQFATGALEFRVSVGKGCPAYNWNMKAS
ncbi:hypothetical protein PENSPDRAFT_736950 [Peniophora sp. CONT]|nr:hypothetical protein PENSPDRAFT_736950 [Peniophora sp. CONT]